MANITVFQVNRIIRKGRMSSPTKCIQQALDNIKGSVYYNTFRCQNCAICCQRVQTSFGDTLYTHTDTHKIQRLMFGCSSSFKMVKLVSASQQKIYMCISRIFVLKMTRILFRSGSTKAASTERIPRSNYIQCFLWTEISELLSSALRWGCFWKGPESSDWATGPLPLPLTPSPLHPSPLPPAAGPHPDDFVYQDYPWHLPGKNSVALRERKGRKPTIPELLVRSSRWRN